jgi:hypothetical protein
VRVRCKVVSGTPERAAEPTPAAMAAVEPPYYREPYVKGGAAIDDAWIRPI